MMCPNCHELIISSLLAEIDEITCHYCKDDVPVRNILISARGMTMNRNDLLKSFFRYKKLLTEVVEERAAMDGDEEFLKTSKKSADQFIETLEEMMAGARDNYRLQFSLTVPVRINYDGKVQSGWLVNISMVGACIETENIYVIPSIGSIVSLEFSLPGHNSKFSMAGMIAWIKDVENGTEIAHDIGIKFMDLNDQARTDLWHLISASVHEVVGSQTSN